MLNSPIGTIEFLGNSSKIDYSLSELETITKQFKVDKRYKIVVEVHPSSKATIIDCQINFFDEQNIKSSPETGEDLALLSFYLNNFKLSVGTVGDIIGVNYEYEFNALRIIMPASEIKANVVFGVAWVYMENKDLEDVSTWYAADPAYF